MASYITKALVDELHPPRVGAEQMEVEAFGGSMNDPLKFHSPMYELRMQRSDGTWENCVLNRVQEITNPFNTVHWDDSKEFMSGADFKDAVTISHEAPAIMIGIRQFWKYLISWKSISPGLYLIETVFGKMLGGESTFRTNNLNKSVSMVAVHHSNEEQVPSKNQVEEWLGLEGIGIREDPIQNDEQAVMLFEQSIQQRPDGHYSVKWPWVDPNPQLPSNFRMAYSRLSSVLRNLQARPDLLAQYNEVFEDQVKRGMLEPAKRNPEGIECFLPHHPVITHKLRIVIDASAHPRGQPSLNDCLYRGPVLLPDLVGVLLRFRLPAIALVGDIEKAFMSIYLDPGIDREVCKILWLKDINKPLSPDNLLIRRYAVVGFGVISSPFILAAVVRHHLQSCGEFANSLIDNLYVDNQLLACDSPEEAVNKYHQVKAIYQQAGMNIREFVSNSTEVNGQLSEEDKLEGPINKFLGLKWDTRKDQFVFDFPQLPSGHPTRRMIFSVVHSIFDPAGLISPCLLRAKLFAQGLWQESITWDSLLSEELVMEWKNITNAWMDQTIHVPRRCTQGAERTCQLHIFSDASTLAFATAVYLRTDTGNWIDCQLIFSKGRLCPKAAGKSLTVPRLELLALLIGVRAKTFVEKQLQGLVSECHVWSDSQIALSWLQSKELQPVFVQRRLKEIRQHTDCTFHYVRTSENPADLATRGLNPRELSASQLWWKGPDWLVRSPEEWPEELTFHLATEVDSPLPELDVCTSGTYVASNQTQRNQTTIDLSRYSTMDKATRVAAYVLRFMGKIAKKGQFTVSDLESARLLLIKEAQQHYMDQLGDLRKYIDDNGIYRLMTRIINHKGNFDLINPIILPVGAQITLLMVSQIHERLLHMGVDWTLGEFLRTYWTPHARRLVKKVIRNCPKCARMCSYPYARPDMPPLPADRVNRLQPFSSVGCDYLGPTKAKLGNGSVKVWIVLFTCLSTRAVYLEPTMDLTAASFTNILRRLISRRGCPSKIISDNGRQFVLANKALLRLCPPSPDQEAEQLNMNTRGIQWLFIPQLSPWMGGFYERLVAIVKNCFMRTLGRRVLTYDELSTFTAEVEAVINHRPLAYVSEEMDAPQPLRPIDLVQHGAQIDLPVAQVDYNEHDRKAPPDDKIISWWKSTQEAVEMFWDRWHTEYLTMLRERSAWQHKGPRLKQCRPPSVGEVVLIGDDLHPRNTWQLARVTELNGTTPNIRSVKLRLPNGHITTRPVSKLYPLECSTRVNQEKDTSEEPEHEAEQLESTQKQPGDKALEMEELEELESTDHQKDQYAKPTKTTKTWNLRPRAKQRTTLTVITPWILAIICLLNLLAPVSALVDCAKCLLTCSNKGILVSTPPQITKMEICCEGDCLIRQASPNVTYELPQEMLLHAYTCKSYFWTTTSETCAIHTTCPAIGDCSL
uniref:Integrase catalytic domain-containing protein n=1 Tax=Meloidogyne incognita TaxID=6306 RepID=A0A914LJ84_MELIC